MSNYTVDFHVYGYNAEIGELISAKDAESSIIAIQVDMKKDHDSEVDRLKTKIAELEKIVKTAKLEAVTEVSSHIEGLSNAKDMRICVDKIQSYYYKQATKLKEQTNDN